MTNLSIVTTASAQNVDATGNSGTSFSLFTTSPNLIFAPMFLQISVTAITNVATGPTFTIGTNASSYNNLLSNTSPGTSAQGNSYQFSFSSPSLSLPVSTSVFINFSVTASSGGIQIPQYFMSVSLVGLYYV